MSDNSRAGAILRMSSLVCTLACAMHVLRAMDLRTNYLGLELGHPLILGASPLSENLDAVRSAEDHGAAAIVLRSLFEEQVTLRDMAGGKTERLPSQAFAEAHYYLGPVSEFRQGPDEYLEHLLRVKTAVSIPVIASLNGITPDGWVDYAGRIERAGADALELNLYAIGSDPEESAAELESRLVEVVRRVRASTSLPLAAKLSPSHSSLSHFALQLERAGVDGLVLFNRFYQPDYDLEHLAVKPRLELSTSSELRWRLRWIAALSSQLKVNLGLSGGVHRPHDVVKGLLAGADAVQVVSEVILHGVRVFETLRAGLCEWMDRNGFHEVGQLRGLLNLAHCSHPAAFERASYLHVLNAWRPLPLDRARGVW
jgi:dihydroorotate dehydrogenase (fumarate)